MNRAEIRAKAREQLGNNIFSSNWLMAILAVIVAAAILGAGSFVVVGSLILAGPMAYGLSYLFLKQSRDNQAMELGNLFKGFTDDFGGTFLLGLMESIYLCLWGLIPVAGSVIMFVKTLSYSMSFYIKADHPEYSWNECITESRRMMNGHKMDLFLLELSFIGWAIVGSLALGVGTIWVSVYEEAAKSQFYLEIKDN